jgi:hypothetical protein
VEAKTVQSDEKNIVRASDRIVIKMQIEIDEAKTWEALGF